MLFYKKNYFFVFFISFLVNISSAAETKITLFTEDYQPPFNMLVNERITGLATELTEELFKRSKIPYEIIMLPWARAINRTQKESNTALYITARTPEREQLFKWVGPILKNRWVFYAKKGSRIKISNIEDAKKYVVGGYNEDGFTSYLLNNGFKRGENIDISLNQKSNILKLENKRIDLWAVGEIQGAWLAKEMKIKNIFPIYAAKEINLFIAFNKDTDDNFINKLNSTFEKMKNDNNIVNIYKKYGIERNVGNF